MSNLSLLGSDKSPLMQILMAETIEPGTTPGYSLCKEIFLAHPLGGKMTSSPVEMAQSQPRVLSVQNAPEEVINRFVETWEEEGTDGYILNAAVISRIYGLGSLVLGCKQQRPSEPLRMEKIWEQDIFFNALDPLNTAGSLVLSQIPGSSDFAKPVTVVANGERYHSSRFQVLMNESPIYIAYTSSAFGFVGRSVFQRALFPLKSFINSMVVDDFITTKNGLLIATQVSQGAYVDKVGALFAALKRMLFKQAHTGQVVSIGKDEKVESLNMQGVDTAGTFARSNILKNIATAADMPAKMLENETMVEGFGEGTEDAKKEAAYIDGIRRKLKRIYKWFDGIMMYRAWTPEFFSRMQAEYPEQYRGRDYRDVFGEWRHNFSAEWPSVLREPESELVKVSAVKFEAAIAVIQTLLPQLDPANKAIAISWLCDTLNEEDMLFPREIVLDIEGLKTNLKRDKKRAEKAEDEASEGGDDDDTGVAKKMGKFDSAGQGAMLANFRRTLDRLPALAARRVTHQAS